MRELRELRARQPELIAARAAERRRRPPQGTDGRLMIVAAEYPARDSLGAAAWPTQWRTGGTCRAVG